MAKRPMTRLRHLGRSVLGRALPLALWCASGALGQWHASLGQPSRTAIAPRLNRQQAGT